MYQITGTLVGVADILFNAFTPKAQEQLVSGSTGGKFTDEERQEEAKNRIYRNDAGHIFLPKWSLKVCLLAGADRANLKEGRKGMAQFLKATVFLAEDPIFVDDSGEPLTDSDYLHQVVGKIPPRTGAAAMIRRPALRPGWRLPFTLNVFDDRRDPRHIESALREAGLLCGLGSWRPEYGRFLVRDLKVNRSAE